MDTIGAFEGCQTWNKKREMLNAEGTESAELKEKRVED